MVRIGGGPADMPPYRRLVLVVSPPAAAEALLDYCDLLAHRLRPDAIRLIVPVDAESSGEQAEPILAALPPALAAARDAGLLTTAHVPGDVLDAVLRETVAVQADLLVVGSDRPGADRRPLVRRLAMKAPCSVWMVPSGVHPAIGRILVPTDFSARSADALHVATALAASTGASCAALHVRSSSTLAGTDAAVDPVLGREREAFHIFAARIDLHGCDVDRIFEEGGDVTRVILRVAEERQADLLVMGTRGRTRAAAMLIGSETEHALQESGIPVLAVKHFGAHLRFLDALLDPGFRRREGPRFS